MEGEREGVEGEGVELTKHTTSKDRLRKCSEGILMTIRDSSNFYLSYFSNFHKKLLY